MIKNTKRKINLSIAPFEVDYIFPKEKFYLGPEYEETDLGYSEGAIRQFRGPHNEHVLEYPSYYKGHRDRTNPHDDPIGHCILDAPEISVSSLIGGVSVFIGAILLFEWKEKKDKEAIKKEEKDRNFWFNLLMVAFVIISVVLLVYIVVRSTRESERKLLFVP